MKNLMKYLIVILLQLQLPLISYAIAQESAEDAMDDDGTDENGKVILSATLVDRCELAGTSDPTITEDCLKKLASDARLGKTPEGDNYDDEARRILKEQTTGYMEIATKRLIETSQHEDKSDELAGKKGEGKGDSRDDVEQIIKLGANIQDITIDVVDTMSLRNTIIGAEIMYFVTIPGLARSMTVEEAQDSALRKSKTVTSESSDE